MIETLHDLEMVQRKTAIVPFTEQDMGNHNRQHTEGHFCVCLCRPNQKDTESKASLSHDLGVTGLAYYIASLASNNYTFSSVCEIRSFRTTCMTTSFYVSYDSVACL